MMRRVAMPAVCLFLFATMAQAADYTVERVEQAPPDDLSSAIAEQLAPEALRVKRGTRTLCDIWIAKQWPIQAGFTSDGVVLYPFHEGQLLGVVQYHRQGGDFRGQDVDQGVYTLRYGQQPVDGNHVGTSPTRDFALLVPAGDDQSADAIDADTLVDLSTKASGTTHPALLCMLATEADTEGTPEMRHHAEQDLWAVRFVGQGDADGAASDLVVEMVVVGHSEH